LNPQVGDLVKFYDARDMTSPVCLGIGIYLGLSTNKSYDFIDVATVLMCDQTKRGAYTYVVLQSLRQAKNKSQT